MSSTTSSAVRGLPVAPGPGEQGGRPASGVVDDSDTADESRGSVWGEEALCAATDELSSIDSANDESPDCVESEATDAVLHAAEQTRQIADNVRALSEPTRPKRAHGGVSSSSCVHSMRPS